MYRAFQTNLHSNMFLLRLAAVSRQLCGFCLFTFQYVSIKTILNSQSDYTGDTFTFQYVSIKTVLYRELFVNGFDLHSNMFLLRLLPRI